LKKILLAVAAVAVLVMGGLLVWAARLVGSLNTPAFQKQVLDQVSAAVGTRVEVKKMDIKLLEGVTLEGVSLANPAPFTGSLATADGVVLRYNLASLLSGRVDVERLSLRKPVIAVVMDQKGSFNYEKLGGGASARPASSSGGGTASASPLKLVISKLAVDDAVVSMVDDRKASFLKIDDASLDSAFTVAGGAAEGRGTASIKTMALADMLFVRSISSPLSLTKDAVRLAPIRGRLADGDVTGDLKMDLKAAKYAMSLDVKGAQVETLLKESGSARAVSGALQAKASFEGTGGLPTMKGKGEAEVTNCKVTQAPVLGLLSSVLQLPELANPNFEQCRLEFTLGGNRMQMPVLSLKGAALQLTGKGTVALANYGLDFDMSLALSQGLVEKIRVNELRAAFKERGDGFSTVDFKVTGTSDHPQTDLAARIGKAAATEALKGQAGKLLGKKKLF
jgi:uncharacterized protein involved in outer membrane biogenesis